MLNAEVEKLEEQINEIKVEIEKYKGAGQSFDNQRKKILKDLEERLEKTEARAALHEQKAEAAARTITALKSGIQSVFEKIGCSATALSDMLGNGGVTEGNMMQYLGIIEQRTNEILQMYAAVQMQQQGSTGEQAAQQSLANILGQGPQVATGVTSISINPPNAGGDDDSQAESDEDEDDHPLTREELKARTLKGLSKKEGKDRKSKGTKSSKPARRKAVKGFEEM